MKKPTKKAAAKKPIKARKVNPISLLPAETRKAMRLGAGWREREIMKKANRVEISGNHIKVETNVSGSMTDFGVFDSKRKIWVN